MIANNAARRSKITGVPGWETEDEEKLLIELARAVPKNGVIVEIGCEFGMSTAAFAHGAHETVTIVSVDLYPNRSDFGNMIQVHKDNLQEAGIQPDRVVRIKEHSHTVGEEWPNVVDWVVNKSAWASPLMPEKIDLLFIDGDHSYKGALGDFKYWCPHVAVGGVIAIHDVAIETNKTPHPLHKEVKKAMEKYFSTCANCWNTVRMVDSIPVLHVIGELNHHGDFHQKVN